MLRSVRNRWNKWRLMQELAVRPHARYDAKENPPVPQNGSWAPLEMRIGQRFDDQVAVLLAERERALKSERVAAINNELGNGEHTYSALVRTTKDRITAARIKWNTAWSQVRDIARLRYKDLQDFKRENLLKRDAVYHPPILAIGVCASAFVAETAVNGALFAEVSRWGLTGGAFNAATLSLPNIVLGLAAGFWGLRACHHIRPLIHHMGIVVTGVSLALALLWNFYVGHLRLLAERLSHTRQELRFADWQAVRARILDDPSAPFASSQALILMLVGLIVVAIALWDGLDGFSDRYPGFARVDRKYRRALADIAAFKASIFAQLARLTRRAIRKVTRQQRTHANKTREAHLILDRARGIITQSDSRIDAQLWVHRECLCEYQQLNAQHRHQVPDRFATLEFPGNRAERPVYDWRGARAEIQKRAKDADHVAVAAIAELERHHLEIMATIEAESATVTTVAVPLAPLITLQPRPV